MLFGILKLDFALPFIENSERQERLLTYRILICAAYLLILWDETFIMI